VCDEGKVIGIKWKKDISQKNYKEKRNNEEFSHIVC
jgi:hypothetical protein